MRFDCLVVLTIGLVVTAGVAIGENLVQSPQVDIDVDIRTTNRPIKATPHAGCFIGNDIRAVDQPHVFRGKGAAQTWKDHVMKLSCTSVMLLRWDLDETFDKLAEYGYNSVELRCRHNPDDSNAEPEFGGRYLSDVSPDNIQDMVVQIRDAVTRTGVKVVALAPACQLDNDDLVDKLIQGARAIDPDEPPAIRIAAAGHDRTKPYLPQFYAARAGFQALVDRLRYSGVKILYEIHVGTVAVSYSRTRELPAGSGPGANRRHI